MLCSNGMALLHFLRSDCPQLNVRPFGRVVFLRGRGENHRGRSINLIPYSYIHGENVADEIDSRSRQPRRGTCDVNGRLGSYTCRGIFVIPLLYYPSQNFRRIEYKCSFFFGRRGQLLNIYHYSHPKYVESH